MHRWPCVSECVRWVLPVAHRDAELRWREHARLPQGRGGSRTGNCVQRGARRNGRRRPRRKRLPGDCRGGRHGEFNRRCPRRASARNEHPLTPWGPGPAWNRGPNWWLVTRITRIRPTCQSVGWPTSVSGCEPAVTAAARGPATDRRGQHREAQSQHEHPSEHDRVPVGAREETLREEGVPDPSATELE